MASGALPPAFPAVRVDDDLYWDGGILSNTPVEAIFDDNPRRSGLIFAVHMWAPNGPDTALHRQFWPVKKIFNMRAARPVTSRVRSSCTRCVTSSANLRKSCPPEVAMTPEVRELASYWLRHAHACRPPAGTCAGRRGPCQGYRLQPHRHPASVAGGIRRYASCAGASAVDRRLRSTGVTPVLHQAEAGKMTFEG